MTHCRMCSQRLPRPGRLCRECERELDRARAIAASVDTLSPAMPLVDVAQLANEPPGGWSAQLRSRPTVVVGAFAVGIAAAIAFYVVDLSHASAPGASVMIDRDLTNVRPRERRAVTPPLPAEPVQRAVGTQSLPAEQVVRVTATPRNAVVPVARTPTMVAAATTNASPVPAASQPTMTAAAPAREEAASYDRVLGLADALETCSHETLFARVACEHHARARFCEAAGAPQIPQCAERPAREYGQ
jgi:hypothetical protein